MILSLAVPRYCWDFNRGSTRIGQVNIPTIRLHQNPLFDQDKLMLARKYTLDSFSSHLAPFREFFTLHPYGAAAHLFRLVSYDE
jgi:hypothetical protein